MSPPGLSLTARDKGLVACRVCTLVCAALPPAGPLARCPRCGSTLRHPRAHALAESWAFLLAAIALYAPANLLPALDTRYLGKTTSSTLTEGVWAFWQQGSHGIAMLIFAASVLVPCGKFLMLGLLLVSAQRQSAWARPFRTRAYRCISLIGYWSMLDVLVIAVVAAVLKFGALGEVVPREGILCFGLVVMLTMLASLRFDPRLTWQEDPPGTSAGSAGLRERIRRLPLCLILGLSSGTLLWIHYDRPFDSAPTPAAVASHEGR